MFTLHNGDCLEYMKSLPADSVDAVVTDPPYGVNKASWDGAIPPAELWQEVSRILRPNGSLLVFGGLKYMPEVMKSIGNSLKYEWVIAWYKSNAMQFGKTGFSVLDLVLWYSKGGAKFENKMRDVIEYPIIPSENDNGHPTPKPEKIMTRLVNAVSGQVIFDPFMGSGTTGVASVKLGRDFIGCEISPEYFAIAESRLKQAVLQPNFFTPSNNRLHLDVGDSPAQGSLFTPEAGSAEGKLPAPAPRR